MIRDPDWRDESQYPGALEMPARWWAWQFLRRNRDYQADYAQWVEERSRHAADFDNIDPPDDARILDKWGAGAIFDPTEPGHQLFPTDSALPRPLHHGSGKPAIHESILRFDLRYPIDRQIEYAKEYLMTQVDFLQRMHLSRGSMPVKFAAKGPHKRKIPEYLRALDAFHAGATVREIASTLYPRLARDLTRDPGIARAEAAIDCGKKLSESGYRDLMTWG